MKKKRDRDLDTLWVNGKKSRQAFLNDYANPEFVRVVEETSNKSTCTSAPTAPKKGKDRRKKTVRSKKG